MNPALFTGRLCWMNMSEEDQQNTIITGHPPENVEINPDGRCLEPGSVGTVAIEEAGDRAPGPRVYCRQCALDRLWQSV